MASDLIGRLGLRCFRVQTLLRVMSNGSRVDAEYWVVFLLSAREPKSPPMNFTNDAQHQSDQGLVRPHGHRGRAIEPERSAHPVRVYTHSHSMAQVPVTVQTASAYVPS